MKTPQFISALLQASKLNQSQFAKKVNVRPATVTEWLKGDYSITFNKAAEICEILGIEIYKILKNK